MNADDQRLLDWAEVSMTGKAHVPSVWRWRTNLNDLLAVRSYEVVDGKFRDKFDAIVFITDDRLFPRVCWTDMFKHFRPCTIVDYTDANVQLVSCSKLHEKGIHIDHIADVANGPWGAFVCDTCGEDLAPVLRKLYRATQHDQNA